MDLLLPRACASCAVASRGPLCAACEAEVEWLRPPLCDRCGAPLRSAASACRECRDRTLRFDGARAAARYAGPARDALIAFKLLGERRSGAALARAVLAAVGNSAAGATITFVPSARAALAERGFNPAERLAGTVAALAGLPLIPLLAKIRATPDLAGLGRDQRRAALDGAFHATRPVPGAILLIDDVYTTGATADACATALKAGGARYVQVATFARTLAHATRNPAQRTRTPAQGARTQAQGARTPAQGNENARRPQQRA